MPINKKIKNLAWILSLFLILGAQAAPSLADTGDSRLPRNVEHSLSRIPENIAQLSGTHAAHKGNDVAFLNDYQDKTIYLVGSTHANVSVQENISQIVSTLVQERSIRYVFSEAATGDASLGFLKKSSNPEKRLEVAEKFLKSNRLSGVEHASLVSKNDFSIWGVENSDYYRQALELYLDYHEKRKEALTHLETLKTLRQKLTSFSSVDSEMNGRLEQTKQAIAKAEFYLTEGTLPPAEGIDDVKIGRYYIQNIAKPLNHSIETFGLIAKIDFVSEKAFQQIDEIIDQYGTLSRQRELEFVNRMFEKMNVENQNEAILIIGAAHVEPARKIIESFNASYAVVRPIVLERSDFTRYHEQLLNQLNLEAFHSLPGSSPSSSMPHGNPTALAMRLILAQAPYDIADGKRPEILNLGEALGSRSKSYVEGVLRIITSIDPKEKNSQAKNIPGSPYMQIEQIALGRPDASQAAPEILDLSTQDLGNFIASAVKQLESEDELEKYAAFKEHVRSLDSVNEIKDKEEREEKMPEIIRSSIRDYEASLEKQHTLSSSARERLIRSIVQTLSGGGIGSPAAFGDVLFELFTNPLLRQRLGQYMNDFFGYTKQKDLVIYVPQPGEQEQIVEFLAHNVSDTSMPLSYKAPENYWQTVELEMSDPIDAIIERQIIEYSVSIYDAAAWQIVLALSGKEEHQSLIDSYTERLVSGASNTMAEIRAYLPPYLYGDERIEVEKDNAYFFRIISDRYLQPDPKDGLIKLENFPNMDLLHHEDWKPITGEQAWAAVIGPLQVSYIRNNGKVPVDSKELKIALGLLPTFTIMRSPIGAIYHVPFGTHGKDAQDISNENNFSMLAAMRMLAQVLEENGMTQMSERARWIEKGILSYMADYAFDEKNGIFYQGGFFVKDEFIPTKVFAVDCQTWGIAVLGPDWIDATYGHGTTYRIWQNTKRRSGYHDDQGILRGIGFTDSRKILSCEWTAGAIVAAQMASDYYAAAEPAWSQEFREDAISMRNGMETMTEMLNEDKEKAYHYANDRFFIPFGWWSNPIPSTVSSAWMYMLNEGFNPFVLGGGEKFRTSYGILTPQSTEIHGAVPSTIAKSIPKEISGTSTKPIVEPNAVPTPDPKPILPVSTAQVFDVKLKPASASAPVPLAATVSKKVEMETENSMEKNADELEKRIRDLQARLGLN